MTHVHNTIQRLNLFATIQLQLFKVLILFALITIQRPCHAQGVSDLDMHNGFGKLNFNLDLNGLKKVASLKKVKMSNYPKDQVYTITNLNDFLVYGYYVQYIHLWFFKNDLFEIEIKLQDQIDILSMGSLRSDILRKVQHEYGSPTSVDTSNNTKNLKKAIFQYWTGRTVTLIESWPWGEASSRFTNDPIHSIAWVTDTWYFLNNKAAAERSQTLGLNQGF